MSKLFSTHTLGSLTLSNRIVMAPMTRSRAIHNLPNELMAEYYAQRSNAGLIITEGTSPSINGLGYARIPGIYSDAQVKAWKQVTNAVHKKNGKIFIQLMHTGRVTHPLNLPAGGKVLAPSSLQLETTKMWVDDKGLLDLPKANEMTIEDIELTIEEHVVAAKNAIRAGFDGVEIHGANGYLVKQFINANTNRRTDEYGGSIEKRAKFLLEITTRIANTIGKDRVGVRVSPYSTFNETPAYPEVDNTYQYIAEQLHGLDIAYLHITDPSTKGEAHNLAKSLRQIFQNTIILSGGFDSVSGEKELEKGNADLIAFGRPFISNPDLVERYKNKLPLNQLKFDLFYTPGATGYTDYPVFEDVHVLN
jgi:N-ethylmaleimide reductase